MLARHARSYRVALFFGVSSALGCNADDGPGTSATVGDTDDPGSTTDGVSSTSNGGSASTSNTTGSTTSSSGGTTTSTSSGSSTASTSGSTDTSATTDTTATTSTSSSSESGSTSATSGSTSTTSSSTSATSTTSGSTSTTSTTGTTGGDGDDYVEGVEIVVDGDVNTILNVSWNQLIASDSTWLEFTFETGNVMTSRPKPGSVGEHRDVVLGVPGDTDVTIRIVNAVGGTEFATSDHHGLTDSVPSGMPTPTVVAYDPTLASPDRWMFGSVEDSEGGSTSGYYRSTFWVYIIDRQGRIVWYWADPATNASTAFQRIARDGEYIVLDRGRQGTRGVLKMSLDWEYHEEIEAPVADCIDVTDDGSLLYDSQNQLWERTAAGQTRSVWNCRDHFGEGFSCYSNTVNWNPLDDTVLLSFPEETTVIEIDRQSGAVVGQYGDAPGSYAFSPSTWEFEYQHFANITPDGTLLVSSHMPGFDDTRMPVAGEHAFIEFTIDRQNQTLVEKWYYNDGPEWAMYKGMAIRLENGNTLGNYGTGGTIREVTPDMQTAFHVKFDVEGGDDFFNKMVGHNELIDDLYALNGGPN